MINESFDYFSTTAIRSLYKLIWVEFKSPMDCAGNAARGKISACVSIDEYDNKLKWN